MSSLEERKKQVRYILKKLSPLYEKDPIEVHYKTPFQLVVAVILSAQCTDKRVNEVTKPLFEKYRTPQDFLQLSPSELEEKIKSTGFYRNKAKSILGAAHKILEEFDGKIPDRMQDLRKLPGFGRKTANVILHELYDKVEGIVVDTHVLRLAQRLELSKNQTPEKVEKDLMLITPKRFWGIVSHVLILHGRRVCFARSPGCVRCVLSRKCPYLKM